MSGTEPVPEPGSEPVTPGWVQGAWVRRSRSLGAAGAEEVSDVVWVQAGRWFADVRVPRGEPTEAALDRAQAFTGSLVCDGTAVTWRHDIDSLGRPAGYEDHAEIEWSADTLIERGAGYVEVWERHGRPGTGAVLEQRHPSDGRLTGRVVAAGNFTVAVWSSPAPGGTAVSLTGGRPGRGWTVGIGVVPWDAIGAAVEGGQAPGWMRLTAG